LRGLFSQEAKRRACKTQTRTAENKLSQFAHFFHPLSAKWTPNPLAADHFYDIPRTRSEMEADSINWVEVDSNSGDPFTVHCEQDNERYCIILDNNGFIAGQQYGVRITAFSTTYLNLIMQDYF
jgi:hypothetical protein